MHNAQQAIAETIPGEYDNTQKTADLSSKPAARQERERENETDSVEVNGFARRELVICGTDGTIEIKPFECPSTIRQTLRPEVDAIIRTDRNHEDCSVELPIPAADPEHRYDEQVKAFAGMVRGVEKNPFSYQHDIDVHRVTMMACGVNP